MKIGPVFALGFILFAVPAAAAGLQAPPPMARILTVAGQGEASAVPDQGEFRASVVTQGKSASEAMRANSRAMNIVLAKLKTFGIPEKSIQTSGVNVSPQYSQAKPGSSEPSHIVGYQVSNTLTVRVEDLSRLGEALDLVLSSGINQVSGVSLSIHDTKPLLAQARAEAVKDAMARAETYAKAAGVTLGPVLSISEGGLEPPRPVAMYAMRGDLQSVPVPISAGEESVSANVVMSFEIR
jgi:uncharacterized protein YggE